MLPHEISATGPAADFAQKLQSTLPQLGTDRLTLRAPRIDDFQAYAEIACGPRGVFLDGPLSRRDAWLDFAQLVATWVLRGHGLWTVTLTESKEVLGFAFVGFESGDHEHELGFLFREIAEGHGYAAEAATAVRGYAFDVLGMKTLVSTIDPDNARSARLAARLGGVRDAMAEAAHDNQILVYRYAKNDEART